VAKISGDSRNRGCEQLKVVHSVLSRQNILNARTITHECMRSIFRAIHFHAWKCRSKASAYRERLELRQNGSHNRDAQRQVELVKAATKAGRGGIAINPASEIAVNAALRDALVVGIPVVVMIHPVKMAQRPHLYFLLEDPAAGAELVTARLNQLLKRHGEVALFGLNPLYPGSTQRFQSVKSDFPTRHEKRLGLVGIWIRSEGNQLRIEKGAAEA
jgi:ABC-type sugar transport system substrate-binding protein